MTAQFSPVKNEYAEIAAFGRAGRLENESVNDYLMRLRVLATHCGFGTGLEKELERQFALHCGIPEVEAKLMRSTTKMTFTQIIAYAISVESSAENLNRLRGPSEAKSRGGVINQVKQERYQERQKQLPSFEHRPSNSRDEKVSFQKCNGCGREAHEEAQKCPANGIECFKCKRLNHFGNVCRSNVRGHENQSNRSKEQWHGSHRGIAARGGSS